MARLRAEEVRRLMNYLSQQIGDPGRIAEQVPVLNELMTMRKKLTELLSKMEGNDALEKLLSDVIANTDKAQALATQLGQEAPKKEGE